MKTAKTNTEEPKAIVEDERLYLISALAVDGSLALKLIEEELSRFKIKAKKSENLGLKQLSYPINKHNELELVSVFFETTPEKIVQFNEAISHQTEIERYLLTSWRGEIEKTVGSRRSKKESKDV